MSYMCIASYQVRHMTNALGYIIVYNMTLMCMNFLYPNINITVVMSHSNSTLDYSYTRKP